MSIQSNQSNSNQASLSNETSRSQNSTDHNFQNRPPHNVAAVAGTKDVILGQMCILTATMKENETPGSYQSVLNTLLAANGLPVFNMGSVVPPRLSRLHFNSPAIAPIEDKGDDVSVVEEEIDARASVDTPPLVVIPEASNGDTLSTVHNSVETDVSLVNKRDRFNLSYLFLIILIWMIQV